MKTIANYFKLVKRYAILSYKNIVEFPIEVVMRIMQLIFEIGFIFLFWFSIFNTGIIFDGWSVQDIIVLSAVNLFSEGVAKITFGFRDLEYFILDGSFDKYLMRPVNSFFSMIMDKLNIFVIISKIAISLLLILYIHLTTISLKTLYLALSLTVLNTVSVELLYGTFSMLAFWFGKIYSARELIFSFKSAKSYPMDIYPDSLLNMFTYLIPLAMISTIPSKVLLGKVTTSKALEYLLVSVIILALNIIIFKTVSKKALNIYNSTGS
ncbi:ABC-2 family transporter protein [Tyzzerella sp. OttesenSCG-928-J15]|nr:ABC-2 family transporter protein [Tyzzerella sp. OttesenSCG-928-J15]